MDPITLPDNGSLSACSEKISCIQSKDDKPLFSIDTDNQLRGILLIHVDEFKFKIILEKKYRNP